MNAYGGWDEATSFDWRCLRDNITLLSPDTIERLNHRIVAEGHRLVPDAAHTVRCDSFVVAADIHYPTDSGLIGDGLRVIIRTSRRLAALLGRPGWRQHDHLRRFVKKHLRTINRIAAGKGPHFRNRLQAAYQDLLDVADRIIARACELLDPALISIGVGPAAKRVERLRAKLLDFVNLTIQACDQAQRRVLAEETVPNGEKLFSLFEPETQLIKRGKVPQPVEFGHRVLIVEDGAGFVCHYAVLPRGAEDREVLVGEMKAGAAAARRADPQCVIRSRVPLAGESGRIGEAGGAALPARDGPCAGRAAGARGDGGVPRVPASACGSGVGDRCVAVGQWPGSLPRSHVRRLLPLCGPGRAGSESSCAGQGADQPRGPEVCGGSVASRSRGGLMRSVGPREG